MQVLADAGQIDERLDSEASSSAAGPIPESIRSRGDSIVPALTITSCSALAVSATPSRTYSTPTQRMPSKASRCALAEVTTVRFAEPEDRSQEGLRDAVATSVLDRQLTEADPVELCAVVVVVERDTGLLRRLDGRSDQRMRLVAGEDGQRPTGAVVLVGAAIEVLRAS